MMGRAHATSGAAVWLGGSLAAVHAGAHIEPLEIAVGAVVCAGAALLPDGDHHNSLVARSLGPVTEGLVRGFAATAAWLHAATKTPVDRPDLDGHRTLSHTAIAAVLAGAGVSLGCLAGGRWVVAVILGALVSLGFRGLGAAGQRKKSGQPPASKVQRKRPSILAQIRRTLARLRRTVWRAAPFAGIGAGLLSAFALPGVSWTWLGLPVAVGCLTHCLGDALTNSGCPILWPLPIAGKRWYLIGTPRLLRFDTGGPVEQWFITPLLTVGALAAAVGLAQT